MEWPTYRVAVHYREFRVHYFGSLYSATSLHFLAPCSSNTAIPKMMPPTPAVRACTGHLKSEIVESTFTDTIFIAFEKSPITVKNSLLPTLIRMGVGGF